MAKNKLNNVKNIVGYFSFCLKPAYLFEENNPQTDVLIFVP
jgi:hypothetical protein